jgi:hypothetical protein
MRLTAPEYQFFKMPAGGKREGVRRKANTATKATAERQKRVAASGFVPLDVLVWAPEMFLAPRIDRALCAPPG